MKNSQGSQKRKGRHRVSTEHLLLKAAKELFAKKGYENARTMEIAQRAGVNEALISRYFGGKEGLLLAVLRNTEEQPLDFTDLKSFFDHGYKYIKRHEQFIRIGTARALLERSMAKQMRLKVIEAKTPPILQGLRKYLLSLNKDKSFTESELEALTILLISCNFSLNFFGRLVYQVNPKKLNLATHLLTETLEKYILEKHIKTKKN